MEPKIIKAYDDFFKNPTPPFVVTFILNILESENFFHLGSGAFKELEVPQPKSWEYHSSQKCTCLN